jgi:CheY-like chemotaxis protein
MTQRQILISRIPPAIRRYGLAVSSVTFALGMALLLESYNFRGVEFPLFLMAIALRLPKVDGLEVLGQIKSDDKLKMIPVVVLTSSREERDMVASYKLGVNAYVVKPVDFHEFVNAIKELGIFWAIINEPPPGSALSVIGLAASGQTPNSWGRLLTSPSASLPRRNFSSWLILSPRSVWCSDPMASGFTPIASRANIWA